MTSPCVAGRSPPGADRVHPYRRLFEDGPRQLAAWLAIDRTRGVAGMIAARPSIPAERYRDRLASAASLAEEAGLAAILVGVGADMRYLTGYPAMPLERLTMLVIPAGGSPSLVAPLLEATPARSCPPAAAGYLPVVTWRETDDPHALVAGMVRDGIAARARAGGAAASPAGAIRIAVSDDLPARHLLRLEERLD